eukprot:CAMPEP_0182927352 /NCGR_PEP_ID=MMETSP0105_2-20130417/13740_1 /TAXON_ID=81532 ORGANISM="Acanthoeca-like sp., Strain 10tr" /NCGR_SAMPLE_ID=MMETSP0105_2 /ASSEMBLY_ACC=CAM_ASM_000205 /LENGTH=545 /DNA_ID=CAMNT_0025065297 /DNA_START=60 /DNA_END=1697 /DNA_ORIENTATION=+
MAAIVERLAAMVGGAAAAADPPVVNAAGGLGSFAVDDLTRLRRFLILGVEGGSYYASERKLGLENAAAISRLIEAGRGSEVVAEALAVSLGGRAAKQSPTLFALAMVSRLGDATARQAAYGAVPQVCRTGTMLFEFLELHMSLGESNGWGRGLRRAVAKVYTEKDADTVAYGITKYKQRNGWTHRDVLRLAHVRPPSKGHQVVLHYAVKGEVLPLPVPGAEDAGADEGHIKAHAFISAVESAKGCDDEVALIKLIEDFRLAWEHLPSDMLKSRPVWAALLPKMPLTAMIRNLGKMTAIGLLAPLSDAVAIVTAKLTDGAALKKARVHPFSVLLAQATYKSGRGVRGSLSWEPVPAVTAALEKAFYLAFGTLVPTGKRFVLGLDVSGSMSARINGSSISAAEASAAMAMVTMRTEEQCHPMAFSDRLVDTGITADDSLADVMAKCDRIRMGATDCAQPMLWAAEAGVEADVFIVYTDCETWAGAVSPVEALRRYRASSGLDAKLIVVGMTSGGFTIADADDAGMLDVVGFDANAPRVMQDFVEGRV